VPLYTWAHNAVAAEHPIELLSQRFLRLIDI
jgi:hypothetical protein